MNIEIGCSHPNYNSDNKKASELHFMYLICTLKCTENIIENTRAVGRITGMLKPK